MTLDAAKQIVNAIVDQQEAIIGPIATVQANTVPGLTISSDHQSIEIVGVPDDVVKNLVHEYEMLFGKVSVEVCKDSVKHIISQVGKQNIPSFLQ